MKEKGIVLLDIDGTVYEGFILLPFASFQVKEGVLSEVNFAQVKSDIESYRSGQWDYEFFAEMVLKSWARGLEGVSYEKVLEQSQRFLQGSGNNFYPYLSKIIDLLQETHDFYFVTGEPQFLGQATTELFGVNGHISSEFEVENGYFTGRVQRALAKRWEKREAIAPVLSNYLVDRSLALGDTPGDIEMLEMVHHAVCVNPAPDLEKYAKEKGWNVVTDKNVDTVVQSLFSLF